MNFAKSPTLKNTIPLCMLCLVWRFCSFGGKRSLFHFSSMSTDKPAFKIVMIGPASVGKTSLLNAFEGKYDDEVKETSIMEIHSIPQVTKDDIEILLNFWDTAGQERFKSLGPMYYQNANAAVGVFDVSRQESFDELQDFIEKFRDTCHTSPIVIAANKIDLVDDKQFNDIENWANSANYHIFFTSAKSGIGVNELLNQLTNMIDVHDHKAEIVKNDSNVSLKEEKEKDGSSKCC